MTPGTGKAVSPILPATRGFPNRMILTEGQIERLPPGFAMVDGCFDPLHKGHIEYFRFATTLGVPVVCNLASDTYIIAQKGRAPLLPEEHRAAVVEAVRYIDHVFISRHGTCWSLKELKPRYYVKGMDWEDRLPDDQVETCRRLGIDVVFARSALSSSTAFINRFLENLHGHPRV